MSQWEPSWPKVTWIVEPGEDEYLDGEKWPLMLEVQAWESNEDDERRIRARATYRLEGTKAT